MSPSWRKVKSTAQVKSLCINKTPLEQMLVGMTYVVHHHYLVVDVAVVRDPEGNEISYGLIPSPPLSKIYAGKDGNNVGLHLHHCQRYTLLKDAVT